MFCRDEHYIVCCTWLRCAGAHRHCGHVEWLCVHIAIHVSGKKFPEQASSHIRWCENRLVRVCARSCIVIMLSDDICLCRHAAHEEQQDAVEQHYFEEATVLTHSFGSKSLVRATSCTFR